MNHQKIFIEYGFDLDNNRYGFGCSVEIENAGGGTEFRTKQRIRPDKITARYFRIWIGKLVFIMDSNRPHFATKRKDRYNFKIIYGISGMKND